MSLRVAIWKDWRREWKGKEGFQAGLVLVGLFFIVFIFAWEDLSGQPGSATVVLWVPMVFAVAAIGGRGMAAEVDRATIDLLRSSPVPLVFHGLSRTLVDFAVGTVVAGGTAALATLLFNLDLGFDLLVFLWASLAGISIVGSLAGALAAQARSRELLLPILMVPLLAPLLLTGVRVTGEAVATGASVSTEAFAMVVGFDLVMGGLAWLLWPVVLESD